LLNQINELEKSLAIDENRFIHAVKEQDMKDYYAQIIQIKQELNALRVRVLY